MYNSDTCDPKLTICQVVELEVQLHELLERMEGVRSRGEDDAALRKHVDFRFRDVVSELKTARAVLEKLKKKQELDGAASTRRYEELELANATLKAQRDELTVGFNKQMRLVQIYKLQRMHYESAWRLANDENEFREMVDGDGDTLEVGTEV